MRSALFVAAAALLAAVLALAAALLARTQGQDINIWLTMGTAALIGTFLAFLFIGKVEPEPEAEGFAIVRTEEKTEVVAQPRDAGPEGRPSEESHEAGAEGAPPERPGSD